MPCTAGLTLLEPVYLSVLCPVSRFCVVRQRLRLFLACCEDVLQPALLFFQVSFSQRHQGEQTAVYLIFLKACASVTIQKLIAQFIE